jgi:polar amino acid transport system permease protein
MFTYQFRWDVIPQNFDFLMSGLQSTLIISAVTLVLAMIGGLVIAMLDMSKFWPTRAIGVAFGEIIRNTPILVQLLWVYYVLPMVLGHQPDGLYRAWSSGWPMYSSAFIAEALSRRHPGGAGRPSRGRPGARAFAAADLHPHRPAAGDPHDLPPLAANFVQLIKYSSLGAVISVTRDHAARHGTVGVDLPAARGLHLHCHRVLPDLLAAGHGHPPVGAAPVQPLTGRRAQNQPIGERHDRRARTHLSELS